jgi:uncharacterized protein
MPRHDHRRTVLWRRLDFPGHDIATLASRIGGWELSGTATFTDPLGPCRLDYIVTCDTDWRTSGVRVRGTVGDRTIDLAVSVDAERQWRLNGADCPAVAGCVDIDLAFTPATNLLPIRRLDLAVGQQAQVTAAWLSFPLLTLQTLPQLYRRETQNTYHYESDGGAFVRTLEVNAAGFVINYPGLWVAEATT